MLTTPFKRPLLFILSALLVVSCSTNNTRPGDPDDARSLTTKTPAVQEKTVKAPQGSQLVAVEVVARIDNSLLPGEPEVPVQSTDLLSRLGRSLVLHDSEQPQVDVQLKWFANHPDYMDRVFVRSSRYLWFIMDEIDKRNMPLDIALLPIVESAFDPFAYSHGRAAGLWQFIPGTATRFGVRQNWWYDGRRDVLDSTRAALDYLQFLHKEFDGDWELAIAGYNSGEGNVRRAIRRNKQAGKPTDFWHLKLPRETSAYVPKLLALSKLVADPGAYGLRLPDLEDQPYFTTVEIDGQIDLAMLAELADEAIDEIYALNPGFNRWATDPDGPHRAVVPVAQGPVLKRNLEKTPSSSRVRWVRHKIRPGDSLITIARQHDTTPAVLQKVNGIRGNLIRAGDFMMIPTATRSLSEYSHSAELRLARTQDKPRAGTQVTHVVKPGDSLWEIATRYGVSTRSLAKWNGMAPRDTLSVGRKLVVWTNQASSPKSEGTASQRLRKIRYTVRNGDSLYKISSRFKVSMGELKNWNNLSDRKYLQPGQKLVMYVDVNRQSGG
ncbi:MAG: LysM peptidoglycan-binding domain-containing protein [Gammaproteobacteria bacterium]